MLVFVEVDLIIGFDFCLNKEQFDLKWLITPQRWHVGTKTNFICTLAVGLDLGLQISFMLIQVSFAIMLKNQVLVLNVFGFWLGSFYTKKKKLDGSNVKWVCHHDILDSWCRICFITYIYDNDG